MKRTLILPAMLAALLPLEPANAARCLVCQCNNGPVRICKGGNVPAPKCETVCENHGGVRTEAEARDDSALAED